MAQEDIMAGDPESDPYFYHKMLLAGAIVGGTYYALSGTTEKVKKYVQPTQEEYSTYGKDQKYWVTEPNAEVPIRRSKEGVASLEPVTIMDVFQKAAKLNPDKIAWEKQDMKTGNWIKKTWADHFQTCKNMAKALIAAGLKQHETINIIGFNSNEWVEANMGCILAGGISAGQYTNNEAEACLYQCDHSKAKFVFVENEKHLKKFVEIHQKTQLEGIICWDEDLDLTQAKKECSCEVYGYQEFMNLGSSVEDAELEKRWSNIRPGHCASLIYTSGTTGRPKAVMISHDNYTWTCKTTFDGCGYGEAFGNHHRVVSYLPFSHVAAQLVDIYSSLEITSNKKGFWGTIYFARPDALKGTLKETLVAAKPTLFFGVPRVWEKFKARIQEIGKKKKPFPLQNIIDWAKATCKARNDSLSYSNQPRMKPFGYGVASTIMGKVKAKLGLDKCKMFMTGAAPIEKSTLEYFKLLDIHVDEVYGMSECTGPSTISRLNHREMCTTGPPVDGVEVILQHEEGRDKKDQGEICYRGRNVMMGYMYNAEKSAAAIDGEGFLHSGDVGQFVDGNFLTITGRIKELLITKGGENIAPVPVEHIIKERLPALSNCIMIGDNRKYCTCLVSLKTKVNMDLDVPTEELTGPAAEVNPDVKTVSEAMKDEKWQQYIKEGIEYYNAEKAVSRAQKIQYFRILPIDLHRPEGTLTATLKIIRPKVYAKYGELIESMYTKKA